MATYYCHVTSPYVYSSLVSDFQVNLHHKSTSLKLTHIFCRRRKCNLIKFSSQIELECGPMPNVMAALPNTGGALCKSSVIPFLVRRRKVRLTPAAGVPSKSRVLVYWQHCCTALQQRASAKLCGVVKGMELRLFRRGRHLFGWAAITLGIGPHSSYGRPM